MQKIPKQMKLLKASEFKEKTYFQFEVKSNEISH